MAEQKSAQERFPQPLRAAASTLQKVPGAGMVSRAAGGTLDRIGTVSPRGRRVAVYTGAGVLGVTGLVEWPVAVTGAAVAWLTQPRSQEQRKGQERAGAEDTTGPEEIGASEGAAAAGTASTAGIEGTAGSRPANAGGGPTSAHRDVASQAIGAGTAEASGEVTPTASQASPSSGSGGAERTGKAG
ncbi:hypothetical protein ACGFNV_34840 [Streptomyces sp. NPDC048751]|uniref:hypothetical protein n=1 Tax=Streptomyces sp. NPDC048751 TaxID=3365591 RepID=UPI003721AC6F